MSNNIIIEGSASNSKILRQSIEILKHLVNNDNVRIVSSDTVINLNEFMSFDKNINKDDKLDAIRTIMDYLSHHTCPYCGYTYPNYPHYHDYLHRTKRIYICPKCKKRE